MHRKPGKQFPQSGDKTDRSLFHANRIGDATTVYVPEGEKDVEVIEAVGGVAVCSAMGAGKAHLFDWSPLKGKHAVIITDKDDKGRQHAAEVAAILEPIAESVQIVQAAVGKDPADHIAAGKTLDDFVEVESEPDDDAKIEDSAGWLSDANISELLVNRVLRGKYCWAKGLGWMRF